MLHEVEGDILLSSASAIAHAVAPGDHFDQGLARELRERWPAMARDFRHYCHTTHPKPGAVWVWAGAGGPRIANLMVQEPAPERGHARPGRARLEHVNQALRALRKLADDEQWPSLALPRLATGVGGLPWGEVEPIIRQHLGTLTIPVAIYVAYKPGVKAKEI